MLRKPELLMNDRASQLTMISGFSIFKRGCMIVLNVFELAVSSRPSTVNMVTSSILHMFVFKVASG